MSNPKDGEWQLHITALLAEVKTNQENMHDKIDAFVVASNKRTDDLEYVVYGNGSEGLSEQVRNLRGKWAVIYGLVLIVLSATAQAAAKELFTVFFK
jgi:hypothetical protein